MRNLAVLVLAVAAGSPPARAAVLEGGPSSGRIVVHVLKTGILSRFAHDHHFEVTEWRATVDVPEGGPAHATAEVVLSAGSLRDRQESLSGGDRRKVEVRAAGPDVLDAEHHPRIEYRADRVTLESGEGARHARGTLHGTLTVRGRSRPVDVAFEAEGVAGGWRVRGRARAKQSELGIRPFSGFGGTVGVKDELEIELDLTLRAGAAGPGEPPSSSRAP